MDNTTQSERHANLQVRKFNILREIMFLLVPKKIDTQSMVKIKLSLQIGLFLGNSLIFLEVEYGYFLQQCNTKSVNIFTEHVVTLILNITLTPV